MRGWTVRVGGAALIGLVIGAIVSPIGRLDAQSSSAETLAQLKLFGDVFERVRAEYVEPVPDRQLIESALNGMLSALDPHSGYLDTERYRDMQVQTRGEFGGLGIEVTMENGLVRVVSPIDDTPAFRAGIQAGDFISHIDDEPVMGLTLSEAVEKMRGPVASTIGLTLVRDGVQEPIRVSLARAIIKISPVRAHEEGRIGYVRLTTFNEQTASAMTQAIENMSRNIKGGMQGLVLDLRNNPGGLLDQAVAVVDAFIDQGEIVSTRGRRPDSVQRFNAKPGDVLDGLPMVVLINGGSASASEIVAGALQDHRRAIVMGTQSFGKGSVQTIIPMRGQGAIRLTTARYYTPAGTSIQAKGIVPDINVEPASIRFLGHEGERREADLRGRLENDQTRGATESSATTPAQPAPTSSNGAAGTTAPPEGAEDFQLARALDLLRGLALVGGRPAQ